MHNLGFKTEQVTLFPSFFIQKIQIKNRKGVFNYGKENNRGANQRHTNST